MTYTLDRSPRVYTASKLSRAQQWIDLRKQRPDIIWTARWPDLVGKVDNDTPENCRLFWLHDVADIRRADVVLVMASEGQNLVGALVEAGVALGLGKHVIVVAVSDTKCYGTWQYHPLVSRVNTLEEALDEITGGWNDERTN